MADEQEWAVDKAEFVAQPHHVDQPVVAPNGSPLVAEFTTLTRALLGAGSTTEALRQLVSTTQRVIPGAKLVSITLRSPDGAFHTPIETEPVATELDQVQYRTGEGPCVDAARQAGPGYVGSDDLAAEPAWPTFGPIAAKHGYQAVLSTVLFPDSGSAQLSGALNIFADHAEALHDGVRETALLLATHASLALAGTEAVALAEVRQNQLRQAIETRDVIGQAKGILMNRRGCSADEAFDLLRRTSQHLNVKINELARTLTTRHNELDPDDAVSE